MKKVSIHVNEKSKYRQIMLGASQILKFDELDRFGTFSRKVLKKGIKVLKFLSKREKIYFHQYFTFFMIFASNSKTLHSALPPIVVCPNFQFP